MAPIATCEFQGLDSRPSTSYSTRSSTHRYTDTFREVKRLYFKRQYRACASLCHETLSLQDRDVHPIQSAILLFFAGLSYDTLARSMPNCSPAILSTIDDAENYFQKAAAALPSLSRATEELQHQTIDEVEEGPSSCRHLQLNSNRNSLSNRTRSSSLRSNSTAPTSVYSDGGPEEDIFNLGTFQFPTALPVPFSQHLRVVNSENIDQNSPPLSPLSCPKTQTTSTDSYNTNLTSLLLTISTHLSSLGAFRETVIRARNREARFGSAGKEMTPEEKMERILRGRERGWKMKRFDRSRYEVLAESALAELGQ